MLVRKARAPKNWREFFFEVGAIVIGVAVALGGQQLGEALKWRHQVDEAETTLRRELQTGVRFAYERAALEACIKAEQDAIEQALVANRDSGTAIPPMNYIVPNTSWPTDGWESAKALQVPGHMPRKTLQAYESTYFFQNRFNAASEQENEVVARLKTLEINAGHLAPAERDRLFLALQEARRIDRLFNPPELYLESLKTLNIAATDKNKQQLVSQPAVAALTKQFPDCVKTPAGF